MPIYAEVWDEKLDRWVYVGVTVERDGEPSDHAVQVHIMRDSESNEILGLRLSADQAAMLLAALSNALLWKKL